MKLPLKMKRIFLEQFTLHVETSALYSRPPSEYFTPPFSLYCAISSTSCNCIGPIWFMMPKEIDNEKNNPPKRLLILQAFNETPVVFYMSVLVQQLRTNLIRLKTFRNQSEPKSAPDALLAQFT